MVQYAGSRDVGGIRGRVSWSRQQSRCQDNGRHGSRCAFQLEFVQDMPGKLHSIVFLSVAVSI